MSKYQEKVKVLRTMLISTVYHYISLNKIITLNYFSVISIILTSNSKERSKEFEAVFKQFIGNALVIDTEVIAGS
jgi:hypothetical protein